jgi:hypothetical protein
VYATDLSRGALERIDRPISGLARRRAAMPTPQRAICRRRARFSLLRHVVERGSAADQNIGRFAARNAPMVWLGQLTETLFPVARRTPAHCPSAHAAGGED